MLQYKLIKKWPKFLRWYRTRVTLDWRCLRSYLPTEGKLLEIGCGIGSLDYELAQTNPELHIYGIDINTESIKMAKAYHNLPNIDYASVELQSVREQFDCILFVDVFHHVSFVCDKDLLEPCARLLKPHGYIFIKDMEREKGQIGWFMDRYISGCRELYFRNCDEMCEIVSQFLNVKESETRYRFPFPHYYIKASRD
jgi:2-polyprenyl-3-methyl-5-hydroxy-6-metoxy-1,4-benzoquinol methylase